jgi:hypothetical protein
MDKSTVVAAKQKNRDRNQLLFWAQLGPMTLLLTLLAATPLVGRFDLPIIAILGSLCCWRWRMRALGGVLCVLIGWVAWQLTSIPQEQRFWYLGVGIAIALGFMVLCLAFDEVKAAIGQLEGEARTRLDALMRQDEQSRRRENQFQLERDRALNQVAALEQRLRDAQRQHALALDTKELERRTLADRFIALQLQKDAQPVASAIVEPVATIVEPAHSGIEEQRTLLQELRRQLFHVQGELHLAQQAAQEPRPEEIALRQQLANAVAEAEIWERDATACQQLIDSLLSRSTG